MNAPSWMGPGRTAPDVARMEAQIALRRFSNACFDLQTQVEELSTVRLNSDNDAGTARALNVLTDVQIALGEALRALHALQEQHKRLATLLRERSRP